MRLLRFAGPRPQLPQGLNSAAELVSRYLDGRKRKDDAESLLQDAYRYALPQRENFRSTHTELERRNNHIFDSTAVLGVPKWAGNVQSKLMPPWRRYTQLIPGPDVPEEVAEDQRIVIGMSKATKTYFSHLNHSNFSVQAHESLQDLAIGTGALNFWRGGIGQPQFLFDAVPMHELVLEEGPMSTIESTWREIQIPVAHMERIYPGAQLNKDEAKALKEQKFSVKAKRIEGVLFDPGTERTFGVLIDRSKDKATIMWQTMWTVSPRIVYRWSVAPGEIYGRGPITQVLPDIKTANKVVEFILRNAAMQVAGIYTSTSDTAVNPYTIKLFPGAVIPVDSNSNNDPTIRALERSGDIGLAFEVLKLIREPIREALNQHELRPEGPVRSASEVVIEDRRRAEDSSSVLGRLQTELVTKVTGRGVNILGDSGRIPPLRIDGTTVTLKHQSPLARAQDLDELLNLQFGLEVLAPLGQEVVALGVKVEDLAAWVAEKFGLDPELIRPKAERAKLQQQAAQVVSEDQNLPQAA